ncbi:interleukin-8 isoform X1 [Micropterus dolomieu]|uniref:interleukin-8 isoform X1 n=1 Tax=Micropterus dolomieu TaxID=147949 RepID=UPI001E8D8DF9|nr:interleukin-8 isoform X1 [Micropterus dolomieu]
MTTKPLLLAALALCCCIATLHASPRQWCRCIRTTSSPINRRVIQKIEVIPISGQCRQTEIIVTKKNGSKVCVKPNEKWINVLLTELQTRNLISSSTTTSPTASTINF